MRALMKLRQFFCLACLGLPAALMWADSGDTTASARAILERVLENRPSKDLALKARLWATRESWVPVEILVKNLPAETRTIYRTKEEAALIVQPVDAPPRYFLMGRGELTGEARLQRLAGSQFRLYDLGLPFLQWSTATLVGQERMRGRTCHLIEVQAEGQPYVKVRLWIDKETMALLRAEAYNQYGDPVQRFTVTSFRRMDEIWIPRAMEVAFVPPGQSLPSEEKSRLEIYDGDYDAELPVEDFDPARFAQP
jgi:hypothetical protein